jgi:hypothetical protein
MTASREYYQKRYIENREEILAYQRGYYIERCARQPLFAVVDQAKYRAKKKGLAFDLSQDMLMPEFCPVLGIRLERAKGTLTRQDASPTLDRIDPKGGYTKENVRVISWRANKLKSNGSPAELRAVAAYATQETNRLPGPTFDAVL